jgi:hypothetical protein
MKTQTAKLVVAAFVSAIVQLSRSKRYPRTSSQGSPRLNLTTMKTRLSSLTPVYTLGFASCFPIALQADTPPQIIETHRRIVMKYLISTKLKSLLICLLMSLLSTVARAQAQVELTSIRSTSNGVSLSNAAVDLARKANPKTKFNTKKF